jgi:hypothetical protein
MKEDAVNGARVYSLERRLAKVEKERGGTDADNPFNEILRDVGEPLCATEGEAFVAVLRLMQIPGWIERLQGCTSL